MENGTHPISFICATWVYLVNRRHCRRPPLTIFVDRRPPGAKRSFGELNSTRVVCVKELLHSKPICIFGLVGSNCGIHGHIQPCVANQDIFLHGVVGSPSSRCIDQTLTLLIYFI